MFDCICLTMGARQPRDMAVPGREKGNIFFALDYLTAQNKLCAAEPLDDVPRINARDKVVVVLGGGDTGSDCVGTARRQRAKKIYQLEILPKPPEATAAGHALADLAPHNANVLLARGGLRTAVVHPDEGLRRNGTKELHGCEVEWVNGRQLENQRAARNGICPEGRSRPARLGFCARQPMRLGAEIGLEIDAKGNVTVKNFQTSEPWVFAAGDTINGASLVVRAIDSGRAAAAAMDHWLRGITIDNRRACPL